MLIPLTMRCLNIHIKRPIPVRVKRLVREGGSSWRGLVCRISRKRGDGVALNITPVKLQSITHELRKAAVLAGSALDAIRRLSAPDHKRCFSRDLPIASLGARIFTQAQGIALISSGVKPRRIVFSVMTRGSMSCCKYSGPPALEPIPDILNPPKGWRPTMAPVIGRLI